jgi:hypothetical protein
LNCWRPLIGGTLVYRSVDQRSRDIRQERHGISHRQNCNTDRCRRCNQNTRLQEARRENSLVQTFPMACSGSAKKRGKGLGLKSRFVGIDGCLLLVFLSTCTPLSRSKKRRNLDFTGAAEPLSRTRYARYCHEMTGLSL